MVVFLVACASHPQPSPSNPSDTTVTDSGTPPDTGSADDSGTPADDSATDDSGDTTDSGDGDSGDTTDTGTPPKEPAVPELGFDQALVLLANDTDGLDVPRDLAWHPVRTNELWVQNRYGLPGDLDGGSVTILTDLGTKDETIETRADVYAYHFMAEASSLAFGAATFSGSEEITFASCQESRNDYGGTSFPNNFMGPTLWPSDLDLFAEVNQHNNLLGSHLDMLHESPQCMGVAWDHDNVYWVFDGWNGNIVRFDFEEDHGLGLDDHSDGVVRRYSDVTVERVANVPGHLVLDAETGWLYIADTGGGRVIRMDTASGLFDEQLTTPLEDLADYSSWLGATVEVVTSDLTQPSGIALHDGRLFVSDHATGEIVVYDAASFDELDRMSTEAPGITGLDIGPDDRIYYVDMTAGELHRVDPL
jgi:hypothetical protein